MITESISELHNAAMLHLDRALVLKFADVTVKKALKAEYPGIEGIDTELRYALELELKAATLADKSNDQETRSLLLKSAAAIAFQAGRYQYSLELAESLLSFAPDSIIVETKEMIKTIKNAQRLNDRELKSKKVRPRRNPTYRFKPLEILVWIAIFTIVGFSIFYSVTANGEPMYLIAVVVALLVFINVVK